MTSPGPSRALFHSGGYALWYSAVALIPLATTAAVPLIAGSNLVAKVVAGRDSPVQVVFWAERAGGDRGGGGHGDRAQGNNEAVGESMRELRKDIWPPGSARCYMRASCRSSPWRQSSSLSSAVISAAP